MGAVPAPLGASAAGGSTAPPRTFEEWLHAPNPLPQPDERYEIRRATPDVFPKIYQLIDTVFERHQPRHVYEWMYRHNPGGLARCLYVLERATGEIVSSTASIPWPVSRGDERLNGVIGIDAVTLQRLQRQGLSEMRRLYNQGHPFYDHTVSLGVPNYKSRASAAKYNRTKPFGPLPFATLPLNCSELLQQHAVPRILAAPAGVLADSAISFWRLARAGGDRSYRVEELPRFDSQMDLVNYTHSRSDHFWCPHDAAFLNWRYVRHPRFSYVAHGLYSRERFQGFSVVRTSGQRAMLMELVAPSSPAQAAGTLLSAAVRTARAAGCERLDVYATPNCKFWKLLKRAGFIARTSNVYASCRWSGHDEASLEEYWTLTPADSDVT